MTTHPSVFIIGPFGSGTSLCSEICARLGYDMGTTEGPNYKNKYGNGEDQPVWLAAIAALGGRPAQYDPILPANPTPVRDALRQRAENAQGPWGVEVPHLSVLLPDVLAKTWKPRVIRMTRDRNDLIASFVHYHLGGRSGHDQPGAHGEAARIIATYDDAAAESAKWAIDNEIPTSVVPFKTLIAHPRVVVPAIAELLEVEDEPLIQRAIEAVDPQHPKFA